MTRQTTTLAGVGAIVAILAAVVMLGVLPQNQAAAAARTNKSDLAQTNTLLNIQLAALAQQSQDLAGLEKDLDRLREEIPASADLAGVTRVIVNSLTADDGTTTATLVSITPQVPAVAFVPREQLTAEVGEPQVAPSAVATEAPPAGSFQEIPLTITATAADIRSAFLFIDLLNDGPRLLAVHNVQITRNDTGSGTTAGDQQDPVTISVVGAAYVQPGAQDAGVGTGR